MFDFINRLFSQYDSVPKNRDSSCVEETDERNFGSSILGEIQKSDLPTTGFIVYDPIQQDQKDTDFCTGYSAAYDDEAKNGQQMSGAFNFACNKYLSNSSIASYGASILGACKATAKSGACPLPLYQYQEGKRDWYANWSNVSYAAQQEALKYIGKSYFEIETPFGWNKFDSLIAHLYKYRSSRQLIRTGANGHAITLIGLVKAGEKHNGRTFSEDMIVAKDSYKRSWSPKTYSLGWYYDGYRYFNRSDVGAFWTCYMVTDMPRSLAEILNLYDSKVVKGSSPSVYLVTNGCKNLIPNEETAWSYGISLWNDVNVITDEEINLIPDGSTLEYNSGKLAKLVTEIANSPQVAKRLKTR